MFDMCRVGGLFVVKEARSQGISCSKEGAVSVIIKEVWSQCLSHCKGGVVSVARL